MSAPQTAGYTGPRLSAVQLDAIRSIAGRGDLWHVNPSTAGVLLARGLIYTIGHRVNSMSGAELTELGRHVLDEDRRASREGVETTAPTRHPAGTALPCVECGADGLQLVTGPGYVIERCTPCGFMIEADQAAQIRARVEGTAS